MKKVILFTLCIITGYFGFSQAPNAFNYQAVVRDAAWNTVPSGVDVTFRITLLQGSSTGPISYSESHNATTANMGLVNLHIGTGTSLYGHIDTISWGSWPYFMKVEFKINNVDSFVDMGTTQLLSVPYAKYAENTGPTGQSSTNYYGRGYVFLAPTDTAYQAITGLDTTINVPNNCTTLISTTGTLYGSNYSSLAIARVTIFIDGQAPPKGGTQVLWVVTDNNVNSGGANWTINYPVQLSPGQHTITVKAKSGDVNNQCSMTIDNGGFFDNSVLTVTHLRK